MNFDFGDVITRSLKNTWKYKSIWGIMTLPMVLSFLVLPVFFVFPFLMESSSEETQMLALIAVGLIFLLWIAAAFFAVPLFSAAASLGVLRIEKGEGGIGFMELIRDGAPYYWRTLGVTLIIQLSIGAVFTIFFLLVFVLSVVTMGIATICLQPVFIFMTPLMYLVIAILEGAYIAVISTGMSAWDAVKHAALTVWQNAWKYVILTMIVYLGSTVISGIVAFPLMLPAMAIPFGLEAAGPGLDGGVVAAAIIGFTCLSFPVMAVISGYFSALMKYVLGITYLRLSAAPESGQTP